MKITGIDTCTTGGQWPPDVDRTEMLAEDAPDYTCIVCDKPLPDYVPQGCCSGHECGCLGMPIEPPVCSEECFSNLPGMRRTNPTKEAAKEIEKMIRCPWCEESLIDDEDGPMSVRRIVLQVLDSVEVRNLKKLAIWRYLKKNKFDGLYCPDEECGCFLNHLFPCSQISPSCCPGHAVAIGNTGEYEIRSPVEHEMLPGEKREGS